LANPGTATSYCQNNGGTRLINADVGATHVWVYTLTQSGGTRQHLCLRGFNAGERITVDRDGGQTFMGVTQQDVNSSAFSTYCNVPLAGNNDPYVVLKAGASPPNAYACVGLLSVNKLITVAPNPGGSQTLITTAND
jgi:hypothetical protein